MPDRSTTTSRVSQVLVWILILGLYLSLKGYQSRDGDQAYRLPILLHRQNPALFADDPFVRSFDTFNPHRGYLALLDAASRTLGLSAALAILFALTFAVTVVSVDRLARAVWPEVGSKVGLVAVGLFLTTKAGNVGTNHLFEPILLDRLIGFALGWLALAQVIERPERGRWPAALAVSLAALVHPSVGLQWGLVLGGSWVAWDIWGNTALEDHGVRRRIPWLATIGVLGLALAPGLMLNLGQGSRLLEGLPSEEFRLLSVELQSPQHMLPHLWRMPQWLAWGSLMILGILSWRNTGSLRPQDTTPPARVRLGLVLAILLAGLGLAWVGIETVQDLQITLSQPFRMATVARGVALIGLSERVLRLWRREGFVGRARAAVLTAGLVDDWALVVATAVECSVISVEGVGSWAKWGQWTRRATSLVGGIVLSGGLIFLVRHDTGSGHLPLLGGLLVAAAATWFSQRRTSGLSWTPRRLAWATLAAWVVPLAALAASFGPAARIRELDGLRGRCRFAAVPVDDIERLAVWCRDHTASEARFIGPPGPKTFRLWSLRSLAFNRAGSPYHAAGLADWSGRFRAHVGFSGPTEAFVRAYRDDRHALERRYHELSVAERAALAVEQGASYVVDAAPGPSSSDRGAENPLELLHVEGRYAVYRLRKGDRTTAATRLSSPQRPDRRAQDSRG
jgi:hypothetical protein